MAWFDRLALVAVMGMAALLRLPGIDARGQFDSDQGHDMLTLVALTRDGVVPLLGPRTSVGDFHHGAFYYYLLAPASAVSNGDPVAVTAFIALLGIAAVALTWWLARSMAGSLAGFLAGFLLAISPAAIEESTFIWNPNPIGFFAVLSLAAAWRAHTGGRAAWWAVALGAAGAVVQLHVLGVVFLLAIVVLGLLELRRDRSVAFGLLGGLGVIALLFLPLLAHELGSGFSETTGVLAYLQGGDAAPSDPISALAFTLLRVVGWPLVGLVTEAPQLAAIALAVTVSLVVAGLRLSRGRTLTGMHWLVGILAWSTVALALAAPSLQRVVAGLPNDHYHAFVDPIVAMLIAIPATGLFVRAVEAWRSSRRPTGLIAATAIAAGLIVLAAVMVERMPPAVDPDGGWPFAKRAGERIVATVNGAPLTLFGLPTSKSTEGIEFPIDAAGGQVLRHIDLIGFPSETDVVVLVCDRLFEHIIGAACGGPAEDAFLNELAATAFDGPTPTLVERFDASPRTAISIYRPVETP